MRSHWIGVVAVLLALVVAPVALAKGPPDKLVLSGPGIAEPVEITNAEQLHDLGMGGLEDFRAPLASQPQVSEGYRLDRFFRQGATYMPFDRAIYYPPNAGQRGLVFYAGPSAVGSGWSEYDGKWFHATAAGDLAMQQLLDHSVSRVALPATGGDAVAFYMQAFAILALVLLCAGGVVVAARR
jgi:hypothetical protein